MGSLLNKLKGREDAPAFTLSGAAGESFTLEDQVGVKRTLLIFYPQDMTSG